MQEELECKHTVLFENKTGITKETKIKQNKKPQTSYIMVIGNPDMKNDIKFKPIKFSK